MIKKWQTLSKIKQEIKDQTFKIINERRDITAPTKFRNFRGYLLGKGDETVQDGGTCINEIKAEYDKPIIA